MYSEKDCTSEPILTTKLKGRYVVISPTFLSAAYRNEEHQLAIVKSGFGCDENYKVNKAIFIQEVNSTEDYYRISECDKNLIGLATDACIDNHIEKFYR